MVKILVHSLEGDGIYIVVFLENGSHEAYCVEDDTRNWHEARAKARLLFHSFQMIRGVANVRFEERP